MNGDDDPTNPPPNSNEAPGPNDPEQNSLPPNSNENTNAPPGVSTTPEQNLPSASSPPPTGQAPPPVDGAAPKRKLKKGRALIVLLIVTAIIGGVVFLAFGNLPAIPEVGGCNAGTPNATFATHQATSTDEAYVSIQLTSINDSNYAEVVHQGSVVGNLTSIGETTEATNLSTGDELQFIGANECGTAPVGNYTVK